MDVPLVGREAELAELLEAVRRGDSAAMSVAVVSGAAGIGKTRLIREVLAQVGDGHRVLHTQADELDAAFPFSVADKLLGGVPAPPPSDDGRPDRPPLQDTSRSAPHHLIDEAVAALEELALEGPVLAVLDDAQWVDAATARLLWSVVSRVKGLPVALVLAARPPVPASPLEHLLVRLAPSARWITLDPLPDDDVRALARWRLAERHPEDVALTQVLAEAEGNPFLVLEVLDAVADLSARDDRQPAPSPDPQRVLHRLAPLAGADRDLLQVASVLGTRFSVRDLCVVTGREAAEVVGGLGRALDAGVLLEDGLHLAFRHALVRQALYEGLAPPLRAALHRDAALRLVASGARALSVADHLLASVEAPDVEGAALLHTAGREAAGGDPGMAVRLLRKAVDAAPAPSGDLVRDLATALLWSGDPSAADEVLGTFGRGSGTGGLALIGARIAALRGDLARAERQLRAAVQSPSLHEDERAEASTELAFLLASTNPAEALQIAEAATAAAPPGSTAWAGARCAVATALVAVGRFQDAVEVSADGVALVTADETAAVALHHPVHHIQAVALARADRIDEAERVLSAGYVISERQGLLWHGPLYLSAVVGLRYALGRWSDAVAEGEAAIALADEIGTRAGLDSIHIVLARIALRAGDLTTSARHLEEAAPLVQPGTSNAISAALLHAELRRARGEAVGDVPVPLRELRARGWRPQPPLDMLRAALELLGDTARVLLDDGIARGPSKTANASWLYFEGTIEADPVRLVAAAEELADTPRLVDRAVTAEAAGNATGGDTGRRWLEAALRLYSEMGAHREAARVEAALRARGVRRGARGPRKRPASGWDSLTDAERQVAVLVAEGLTNRAIGERLFISRRTVETHVSHALQKLAVQSRVELARVAVTTGASTPRA